MKCPYCENNISDFDENCPSCKINIEGYKADIKYSEDKFYKKWWFWLIVAFFVIFSLTSIIPAVQDLNKSKLEYRLIREGKITYANQIVEQVVGNLKNNEIEEIKKHLSSGCILYHNVGNQVYSLERCFENVEAYETHRIEKRGNALENKETYRIYWNGWNTEESSQIIDIYLEKVINKEEITYEIEMIIFLASY